MKLIRLGEPGRERPHVLLDNELVLDVSDLTDDFTPGFLAGGGIERLREAIPSREATATRLPKDVRIGAPIPRPGKIICIGLNYADHAAETGAKVPAEPEVFMKASNTLVGPYDDVYIPRKSVKTDYEVELAILIGKPARYLETEEEVDDVIAGFMVCNDVSEREFQLERGSQWDKGKGCETFNPAGPYLVTKDEVAALGALDLWLDVNGSRRQSSNTKNMIAPVGKIVHYLSQFMVLEPGDLINTGTPGGVALATGRPEDYLKPGDVVELGITGLGSQRQTFVPAP